MTRRTLLQQGGPAYPVSRDMAHLLAMAERENGSEPTEQAYIEAVAKVLQGPSLRDDFAKAAMQSLVLRLGGSGSIGNDHDGSLSHLAQEAYAMADAMLKARDA